MEIEYEVFLAYLFEIAQDCLNSNNITNKKFSFVLQLLETHQVQCLDVDCICQKKEDFFEFFKQAYNSNSNILLVEANKFKRIKSFVTGKANALLQSSLALLKQETFYQ